MESWSEEIPPLTPISFHFCIRKRYFIVLNLLPGWGMYFSYSATLMSLTVKLSVFVTSTNILDIKSFCIVLKKKVVLMRSGVLLDSPVPMGTWGKSCCGLCRLTTECAKWQPGSGGQQDSLFITLHRICKILFVMFLYIEQIPWLCHTFVETNKFHTFPYLEKSHSEFHTFKGFPYRTDTL